MDPQIFSFIEQHGVHIFTKNKALIECPHYFKKTAVKPDSSAQTFGFLESKLFKLDYSLAAKQVNGDYTSAYSEKMGYQRS